METVKEQILNLLDQLSEDAQIAVLDYAREKMRPAGETGKQFLERMAHISIEASELELMKQAIEEAFESIESDEPDAFA
jgi:hypothetical protein